MSQIADQNKPEPLEVVPTTTGHRALSVLAKVTLVALLGNALAYTAYVLLFALLLHHVFLPAFFIFSIPTVLAAGLVATRWRWTPAVGAALVLMTSTIFFSNAQIQYYLTHPDYRPAFFFAGVLILACALITIVAGLSATLQNYRTSPPGLSACASVRPAPSWLRPLLLVLSGVVIGMGLVALLVAANPQASSASSTTNGEPTVHMGADNFVQNVVLVPKGSKLLLVNDTTVEHNLQNGFWTSSGTVVTPAEPGAPVLHNVDSTGGSLEIGPFNTAGTFHIHCTIHPGMNLTIVVH
jgi:plastocyanin